MKTLIGPFSRNRIVLCSADAGPGSQKDIPDQAAYFFPQAKWVGAVRNAAESLRCGFVILTTGHGMVNSTDIIQPYDLHINEYAEQVKSNWLKTIPHCLRDNRCDILVFYAGGCPREPMIELMLPILEKMKISLLTFGRPNMYDFDKIYEIVDALESGTTVADLKSILKKPERFQYYPVGSKRDLSISATIGLQEEKRRYDRLSKFKILFDDGGKPYDSLFIKGCISNFGKSYNTTVWEIINNSRKGINREIFFKNVATLMPNFKMTRAGPFKGVKYLVGRVKDPNGQIAACWEGIGSNAVKLRNFLDLHKKDRARVLIEILRPAQNEVASELWEMFKKLASLCMGKNTLGLVAASKVLFAVFPEVALPIDNTQWRRVFKTIDYGDIIILMAEEITEWERRTGKRLDSCEPQPLTTLPAIYNVMAMKAKP